MVEVVAAAVGDGAAFAVEACTIKSCELSLSLVEGAFDNGGVTGVTALVLVSAMGAEAIVLVGLEFGAGGGDLVCAGARVSAANNTAAPQM